jgi:hypothetical protein
LIKQVKPAQTAYAQKMFLVNEQVHNTRIKVFALLHCTHKLEKDNLSCEDTNPSGSTAGT